MTYGTPHSDFILENLSGTIFLTSFLKIKYMFTTCFNFCTICIVKPHTSNPSPILTSYLLKGHSTVYCRLSQIKSRDEQVYTSYQQISGIKAYMKNIPFNAVLYLYYFKYNRYKYINMSLYLLPIIIYTTRLRLGYEGPGQGALLLCTVLSIQHWEFIDKRRT